MSDKTTPETDAAWQSDKDTIFRVMTSRRLERERDEAREAFVIATDEMVKAQCRTREALRERDELIADVHQPELCNEKMLRLEKERDEAREKIKRQTERIRQLEGATNHSCGTPLTIALCERDEARRVLEEISLYLSVGMGDESTTAKQYHERILEGIKMLTDPMVQNWKEALKERDEARTIASDLAEQAVRLRKQRDEAREKLAHITIAAQAVVDRWEQPAWKDTEPTASVIYRLRNVLSKDNN